jgi:hypothetical protein
MCITLLPHSHSFYMHMSKTGTKSQRPRRKKKGGKLKLEKKSAKSEMEFSLEDMKEQLVKLGISTEGCLVKEDCLARLLEFRAALDAKGA